MKKRELVNLLNRTAAALETPDDLENPGDLIALVEDLTTAAKELEEGSHGMSHGLPVSLYEASKLVGTDPNENGFSVGIDASFVIGLDVHPDVFNTEDPEIKRALEVVAAENLLDWMVAADIIDDWKDGAAEILADNINRVYDLDAKEG